MLSVRPLRVNGSSTRVLWLEHDQDAGSSLEAMVGEARNTANSSPLSSSLLSLTSSMPFSRCSQRQAHLFRWSISRPGHLNEVLRHPLSQQEQASRSIKAFALFPCILPPLLSQSHQRFQVRYERSLVVLSPCDGISKVPIAFSPGGFCQTIIFSRRCFSRLRNYIKHRFDRFASYHPSLRCHGLCPTAGRVHPRRLRGRGRMPSLLRASQF